MPRNKRTSHRGFTLIEIMIALLVIAIGLGAAVQSIGATASNTGYMRSSTFAQWVGQNQMTLFRIEGAWFSGRQTGSANMYDLSWTWQAETEDTPNDKLRKVTIKVYLDAQGSPDPDSPLGLVIGYIVEPTGDN